jgi:hypothetical protein
MKQKLLYLLPLLLAVGTGCLKSDYKPYVFPSGTFSGTFGYLHRANDKLLFDTLKASVTLTLQNSNSTFTVTGDTTTLQAGSFGTYAIGANIIQFTDKTYSTTGINAKKHLNGIYAYIYDGSRFNLLYNISDTISMQYQLIKN